jgi:hypothetical protein
MCFFSQDDDLVGPWGDHDDEGEDEEEEHYYS